jgi:PAS domain S-box-containing protein
MEDHPNTAGPEPAEGAGSRGGLSSTEVRYRALLDATPDLVFHLDRQGRFLDFVSPKGEQLAIAPSEFLGRTVSELLPEDLARRVTHHLERALQTGETQIFRCSFPVPLPDGNLRDYEARIAASGKDEVVAVARDITPSRRAHSALRESEARYRQVFEHVHDVFYHMDMNGILTEVSPSAKWWGYGPDELTGTPVVDIYDDPEERSALLKVLLEQGSVADFEIRLKTRDGRVMDASVSSHVLRDENGVPVAIEGIARDITPRKQAEKALRQSEERLRTLVTNAPVIMFAIDREGVFTVAEGASWDSGRRITSVAASSICTASCRVYATPPGVRWLAKRSARLWI